MRRIVGLFVVFASVVLVVPCFAAVPSVTDGLVGCWDFDEGSLVTAIDMSGNGNDGTMMNTTYADPPPGTLSTASLYFNNTQGGNAYSYVTVPDSPSLRPNSSLTIAAWVKTNSTELRDRHIVAKQYGSGNLDSFVLWYRYDNTLSLYIENGTSHPHIWTELPSADEWHHIVGTYDGFYMRLYVDGVERANGTLTGSIPYDSNAVLIGAEDENPDNIPEAGWNGFIDEVMIYNRSLTQAEILQIIPEFPSALIVPLFMSAAIIGVIVYPWKRRKHTNLSFS